ncbi:MAG: DUF6311 domain-containing protein [Deferribacteraceae bacterium]|jgi:hypothetical protein|nr:DUF6311 domain-containing protein [Deferribacteraceae bacterium]
MNDLMPYKKFLQSFVNNSNWFVFIFCSVLGGLFFIKVYGIYVLDFTYTDWLMNSGDLTQHYLGWELLRHSSWSFPLGLMEGVVHPFKESVVYTDSIPLFAFFFKILSPILPNNFQYFGLFGILVYTLQGGISGLIIKKITNSVTISIIGSLFFILSTVMAERLFAHTALAAHFIILICIYICIVKRKKQNGWGNILKNTLIWSSILTLATLIHFYLTFMVLFFMVFYTINDFYEQKKPVNILIKIAVPILTLWLVMFSIGMFHSGSSKKTSNAGYASANLNTFINPAVNAFINNEDLGSPFLPTIPYAIKWQYEGNAYLGFGMILCVIFVFITIFFKRKKFKAMFYDKRFLWETKITSLLILSLSIFAISPRVTLNGKVLFEYSIPGFMYVWGIFRSTGRMIWPVFYIIMFYAIWVIAKEYKQKTAIFALLFFLLIQLYDLHNFFVTKGNIFSNHVEWETNLKSEFWNKLAKTQKHIVFLGELPEHNNLYALTKYAIDNRMTVNDFYLARKNTELISSYERDEMKRIYNGQADKDTIYIFSEDTFNAVPFLKRLYVYKIDDIIVGFKNKQ